MPLVADPRPAAAPAPALPPVLAVGCLLAVLVGTGLRLEGLGRKAFWYDEVDTALRISGRTEADVTAFGDSREIRAGDLVGEFQGVGVRPATLGDVLRSTLADEPQGGAIYFPLARQWARAFGDAPPTLRVLSALASLVTLGLLAALATGLFADRRATLLMVALAAVSPLQLRYAHEARSYALWGAGIALATLMLVRAVRDGRIGTWLAYSVSCTFLLLLQPLSILVLGAHAAVVLSCRRSRPADLRRFVWAVLGAGAAWMPWLVAAATRGEAAARTLAWTSENPAPLERLRGWSWLVTGLFFRTGAEGGLLPVDTGGGIVMTGSRVVLTMGLFAVVVLALVGIAGRARARAPVDPETIAAPDPFAARIVLCLALLPFAVLALVDVTLGGRRASVDRYLVPCWFGLELAVAWWLTSTRERWRTWVAVALLALGIATGLRSRSTTVWWNTNPEALRDLDGVVARLEADGDAVLVTDLGPLHLLQLARHLDPSRRLRLGVSAARALPAEEWESAWLVAPSAELRRAAAAVSGRRVERFRPGVEIELWRVTDGATRS